MEAIDTELEEMKKSATKLLEGAAEVFNLGLRNPREEWLKSPFCETIKEIEKMSDVNEVAVCALGAVYGVVVGIRKAAKNA